MLKSKVKSPICGYFDDIFYVYTHRTYDYQKILRKSGCKIRKPGYESNKAWLEKLKY